MTRREFYQSVVSLSNDKGISRPDAYEIVEKQYLKKHKCRRYVSYRSFYHVNYRTMVRELKSCRNSSKQIKELNDLCEEFLAGKVTQQEMIERIKQTL